MSEVSRRRQGEMLRAVFEVLLSHPDGLPARLAIAERGQRDHLDDAERTDYPSRPGVRRLDKLVRFATINAVKAGWMVKTKGVC